MKNIVFYIKEDLLEELDAYVINHKMSRAEAVREAIKLLLQTGTNKETILNDDNYIRKKQRAVGFMIEEDLLEKLNEYAINHKMSRAEAVREAIKLLLQTEREKETIPSDNRHIRRNMKTVSFKIEIEKDLLEELDMYAINHKMTRAEAVRKAILLLLRIEREKETIPEKAKIEKIKLFEVYYSEVKSKYPDLKWGVRVIVFKIEKDLLEELDAYAADNKMSRSEAIREAIRLLLQSEHKKETINSNYIGGELRVVSFKIEKDLLEKLDMYAANNKMSRSEAIREAIRLLLQSRNKKETALGAK